MDTMEISTVIKKQKLFLMAIDNKQLIQIRFISNKERTEIIRVCAPLDFATGQREKVKTFRFFVYDIDNRHTIGIAVDQLIDIHVLDEVFDPEEIISWNRSGKSWNYKRDWGSQS